MASILDIFGTAAPAAVEGFEKKTTKIKDMRQQQAEFQFRKEEMEATVDLKKQNLQLKRDQLQQARLTSKLNAFARVATSKTPLAKAAALALATELSDAIPAFREFKDLISKELVANPNFAKQVEAIVTDPKFFALWKAETAGLTEIDDIISVTGSIITRFQASETQRLAEAKEGIPPGGAERTTLAGQPSPTAPGIAGVAGRALVEKQEESEIRKGTIAGKAIDQVGKILTAVKSLQLNKKKLTVKEIKTQGQLINALILVAASENPNLKEPLAGMDVLIKGGKLEELIQKLTSLLSIGKPEVVIEQQTAPINPADASEDEIARIIKGK